MSPISPAIALLLFTTANQTFILICIIPCSYESPCLHVPLWIPCCVRWTYVCMYVCVLFLVHFSSLHLKPKNSFISTILCGHHPFRGGERGRVGESGKVAANFRCQCCCSKTSVVPCFSFGHTNIYSELKSSKHFCVAIVLMHNWARGWWWQGKMD